MESTGAGRMRPLQRRPGLPLSAAIAGIALLAAAGAIINAAGLDAAGGPNPVLQSALLDWIILCFVFSGLVAWRRRPESLLGPLMIAGGLATVVSSVSSFDTTLTQTIGQSFDLVPFAVFLHIFLAFPSGELRSRGERALVVATYVVAVGLQLLILILGGFDPNNSFALTDAPQLAHDIYRWQLTSLAALLLGGIVVLIARRVRAGRPSRPVVALLINAFSLALVMSAAVLLMGAWDVESSLFLPVQRATFVVVGLSAIVFLLVLLDARLARASIGSLLIELRAEPPPDDLRGPLSRALHDPTLEVGFWLPAYGGWADPDGRELPLPASDDPGRSMTLIDREGEHLAVLVHDPLLDDEPEMLHAVSAAAAFSLENQRLQVELKAKLKELEGSRGRVIQAGQQERKRLERNLHDGAQQRLIALSLDLGMLESRLGDDPEARERIEAARAEIAVSLEELRDVARGLHPAVLSGHGLAVALQSLVSNAPVPVELEVELGRRLEESVEVAAYYVVNESLANIGKHAEAQSARVVVTEAAGELVVEITDDGVGGADSEKGSGLRGLADRVEALGGRLRIWTPHDGGTRVRAEMPCG
jgi:signal transduction histidine kinase